jgi:hypothetical protein
MSKKRKNVYSLKITIGEDGIILVRNFNSINGVSLNDDKNEEIRNIVQNELWFQSLGSFHQNCGVDLTFYILKDDILLDKTSYLVNNCSPSVKRNINFKPIIKDIVKVLQNPL